MNKSEYKIFVNGERRGAVKTADIAQFIKESYPNVKTVVNEEEKELFVYADILEVMKNALKKGEKYENKR